MKNTFLKLKSYLLSKNRNKLVYRFISEREKRAIENKDFSQLGNLWNGFKGGNTHKYKKGIKYIHFIDNKNDALTVYHEIGKNKQYFCTYSIPNNILRKYLGKGFYMPTGYELYNTIKEYAIPNNEFNTNWIVSIIPTTELLNEMHNIKN